MKKLLVCLCLFLSIFAINSCGQKLENPSEKQEDSSTELNQNNEEKGVEIEQEKNQEENADAVTNEENSEEQSADMSGYKYLLYSKSNLEIPLLGFNIPDSYAVMESHESGKSYKGNIQPSSYNIFLIKDEKYITFCASVDEEDILEDQYFVYLDSDSKYPAEFQEEVETKWGTARLYFVTEESSYVDEYTSPVSYSEVAIIHISNSVVMFRIFVDGNTYTGEMAQLLPLMTNEETASDNNEMIDNQTVIGDDWDYIIYDTENPNDPKAVLGFRNVDEWEYREGSDRLSSGNRTYFHEYQIQQDLKIIHVETRPELYDLYFKSGVTGSGLKITNMEEAGKMEIAAGTGTLYAIEVQYDDNNTQKEAVGVIRNNGSDVFIEYANYFNVEDPVQELQELLPLFFGE